MTRTYTSRRVPMFLLLAACLAPTTSAVDAPLELAPAGPVVPAVPGETCAEVDLGEDCDVVTSCCRYVDVEDLSTYDCRLILDELTFDCDGINCGYAVLQISPYACPT